MSGATGAFRVLTNSFSPPEEKFTEAAAPEDGSCASYREDLERVLRSADAAAASELADDDEGSVT